MTKRFFWYWFCVSNLNRDITAGIAILGPCNKLLRGGGGVQAFHFGKNDFELGVGGDHSCQTFEILWKGSKTPQKAGQRW